MSQIYVVIGANRGIGLSMVEQLTSQHPSATVYGTARNIEGAKALHELAEKHSNFKPLAADVTDADSIKAAAAVVAKKSGHVDVLIHNAGQAGVRVPLKGVNVADTTRLWKINALGPIIVYQHFRELVLKSTTKKWALISSQVGSLSGYIPMPSASYGGSKAALNYFVRALASENKGQLIVNAYNPGFVMTDMGLDMVEWSKERGIDLSGFPTLSPEESAKAVLDLIEKTSDSDKFISHTGAELAW